MPETLPRDFVDMGRQYERHLDRFTKFVTALADELAVVPGFEAVARPVGRLDFKLFGRLYLLRLEATPTQQALHPSLALYKADSAPWKTEPELLGRAQFTDSQPSETTPVRLFLSLFSMAIGK